MFVPSVCHTREERERAKTCLPRLTHACGLYSGAAFFHRCPAAIMRLGAFSERYNSSNSSESPYLNFVGPWTPAPHADCDVHRPTGTQEEAGRLSLPAHRVARAGREMASEEADASGSEDMDLHGVKALVDEYLRQHAPEATSLSAQSLRFCALRLLLLQAKAQSKMGPRDALDLVACLYVLFVDERLLNERQYILGIDAGKIFSTMITLCEGAHLQPDDVRASIRSVDKRGNATWMATQPDFVRELFPHLSDRGHVADPLTVQVERWKASSMGVGLGIGISGGGGGGGRSLNPRLAQILEHAPSVDADDADDEGDLGQEQRASRSGWSHEQVRGPAASSSASTMRSELSRITTATGPGYDVMPGSTSDQPSVVGIQ